MIRLETRPFPDWLVAAVLLVIFLICYASVWFHEYGFLDEYYDIVPGVQEMVLKKRIQEGRPLYAILYGILTTDGLHIADLRWLRLMGIVGLSLLTFSMFRALVRTGWNRFESLCLSIILGTTLPCQLYVAWATTSIFPFAALVSGFALLLAERARVAHCPLRRNLFVTGAVLVLLFAISIYQMAAMFFWVMAAVILLKPETSHQEIARRLAWYGIICIASLLLGFLVYKAGSSLYSIISDRQISFDLPGRFEYLLRILPTIWNFSFLSPYHFFFSPEGTPRSHTYNYTIQDGIIASIFSFFIFSGLMLYFKGTAHKRLLKCFIALSIMPLSLVPVLAVETGLHMYRIQLAPTSLVVVYMFFALHGCVRPWRFFASICVNMVMTIAVVVSILLAAHHVRSYIVMPQVEELEVMRFPLDQEDLSGMESVHVIRPAPGWESLAPLLRLEFGQTSSTYDWHVPPMIFHLLRDADKRNSARKNTYQLRGNEMIVTDTTQISVTSTADTGVKTTDLPSDSLVVDMRNLAVRLQAYRWIDGMTVPGTPVIRSVFNVHLGENDLYYVKDSCTREDTYANFFLHVFPENPEDLPDYRKQHGFDNSDFSFEWHGVIYNGKCMAIAQRPDHTDARIVTGQYISGSRKILWKGEFRIGATRNSEGPG